MESDINLGKNRFQMVSMWMQRSIVVLSNCLTSLLRLLIICSTRP